jgi:lipoyl(octanoyl) transferase
MLTNLQLIKALILDNFIVKYFNCDNYNDIYMQMQNFTLNRQFNTKNEIWLVNHSPVFTLGLAGLESHILFNNHNIPIVRCDRGGQVTYHDLGQIVAYTLIDLKRENINTRQLVTTLENSVINHLTTYNITANSDKNAPGVYIDNKKIASIGLRIKNHCSYHGISYNINMNITPFEYINVCGYQNLKVTQLKDFIDNIDFESIQEEYLHILINELINLFRQDKSEKD